MSGANTQKEAPKRNSGLLVTVGQMGKVRGAATGEVGQVQMEGGWGGEVGRGKDKRKCRKEGRRKVTWGLGREGKRERERGSNREREGEKERGSNREREREGKTEIQREVASD